MKFQYLGTAAAEGWPGLFCDCDSCRKAKTIGGRNVRTRSQAIIDDRLLIDLPADTYMHVLQNGLDLLKIQNCIVTHDHSDHLYPDDLITRREGFAYIDPETVLTIHGTIPTGIKVQQLINRAGLKNRVRFHPVSPFESYKIDGYTIIPLRADHAYLSDPVIYIIDDGTKCILYANDTGYFPDATWEYLETYHPHFDMVSLDCTMITEKCRNNHMDLETNIEVKRRLIHKRCADNGTNFFINHFSHNGRLIYDELVPVAAKHGFLVSYDGLKFTI